MQNDIGNIKLLLKTQILKPGEKFAKDKFSDYVKQSLWDFKVRSFGIKRFSKQPWLYQPGSASLDTGGLPLILPKYAHLERIWVTEEAVFT